MALAPADFYAYSRATGVTIPEDPEERAQMAPEVAAFRRNQLKAPESQGPDPLAIGIGLGLAAAGGAGAAYGLNRLFLGANKAEKTAPVGVNLADLTQIAGIRFRQQPKSAAPPQSKPYTPATPVQDPWLGTVPTKSTQVSTQTTYALKPSTIDLTSLQQEELPTVIKQNVQASDPGLDQVVNRNVIVPQQREVTPLLSFLRNQDQIARNAALEQELQGFPQEKARNAAVQGKRPIVSGNVWEIEDQLEELNRQAEQYYATQEARWERGGRTVADLTGELEINPALGKQLRKEGINVRGGRAVQLSQFSESAAREKIGVNRFTPEEILERTIAAVSYPREIRDKLLDPNVPREAIKDFLGTTPKIRGGAVSVNPTMEVAGGARASMPGADMEEIETATTGGTGLTYHDTTNLKQFQQKEKLERAGFVYDPNTGNYHSEIDDTEIDPTELMTSVPKNATDYGDTEGVGNLLIETETFRERTNQGTTQIPGAIQQMSGRAPGSERQERFQDVVTPLRRDPSGVQTTGLQVVANPELPFGRQLRSQDTGYRQGNRLVSEDLSTQGTRLVGGFETAQPSVSEFISTVPVTDWRPNSGIIRGADGRLYSAAGQEVVGEQPLLGVRRTPLMAPDPQTGKQRRIGFTTLKTAKLEPLTLSRQELQEVAEDAKNMYFNNPSAKLVYLQERNPQALELGRAQGKTLSEIGEAYDYQGFIANQIDNYLMNNAGIDLPILKPQVSTTTGNPYLPKEGGSFVMNLLKTTKDSPIFGQRFAVDAQGKRIPKRNEAGKIVTNKGGYVEYELEGDVMPIPGAYETTGGGGVDPMTIGDDYEGGNVSYYTPRVDTASQRKVMGTAKKLGVPAEQMIGATSTPTGTLMSLLRTQAEVKPVGMRVKSPGSFARTQNPYTGPAAPVMGPASRVLSGNYQYTDPQLTVRLEPTSQAQLQQRNQFALAANLTPGGQVVRGQMELGSNLGTIPAGLGSLTETQTVNRYGLTGSQLQQFGNQLMSQAAARRTTPAPAPEPNPIQERNDAIARHIGNYISAASQRMEGPASIQGVKLKGVGQNALRPYQAPSEGMIQQLMRIARRR